MGESAYSWTDRDGTLRHPTPDHCRKLVDWVVCDFENCRSGNEKLPFMVKLSRALAKDEWPSSERLRFVWNRVAFTNYIRETVGHGSRVRPSPAMWQAACEAFPQLLEQLRPSYVIVLGREMWRNMPETQLCVSESIQSYALADGSLAQCHALKHPSRGLGWQELGAVIHSYCGAELTAECCKPSQLTFGQRSI